MIRQRWGPIAGKLNIKYRTHKTPKPIDLCFFCILTTFSYRSAIEHVNAMPINENPIFVFVPGAWHTPDTFDTVRDLLEKRGFETDAVPTPSVGASPPDKGLHADIEYTKAVLQRLVDQGRQVVLVNHSYGGMVGASAVQNLGYAQRSKSGLPGGVIMVVWFAAFVTPKDKSALDMLGGNLLPWMLVKVRACLE